MSLYQDMFSNLTESEIRGIFSIVYGQTYEPWVEFRNTDINESLVSVTGVIRKTSPEYSSTKSNPLKVYYFGGSTMQGVHVTDYQTIPSF